MPGRLVAAVPRYEAALEGIGSADAARRPAPEVWSALEYCCHVRDVLLVERDRVVLALMEDRPSVARMHRDERVLLCRYVSQAPAVVLDQLAMAAELAALVFSALRPADWSRLLVYNWPEPAEHDLAWLGRHTVHECEHHLGDVTEVLARVGASGP